MLGIPADPHNLIAFLATNGNVSAAAPSFRRKSPFSTSTKPGSS